MLKKITHELVHHAPFTLTGSALGILIVVLTHGFSYHVSETLFYLFHPAHIFLGAFATASMYQFHKCTHGRHQCNIYKLFAVGLAGSLGLGTLSDSLIPFWGETIMHLEHAHVQIGFLEKWWIVNPLAILGVTLAYFYPATKFPHLSHVLLSTCASLFHIMMAVQGDIGWVTAAGLFIFLFLAVWLPCCLSDIVFPLLFIPNKKTEHHHA